MLQVLYKCGLCDLPERRVTVPHRKENEDIRGWMDELTMRLIRDHFDQRPLCKGRQFEYVKIPVTDDETGIGMVPRRKDGN